MAIYLNEFECNTDSITGTSMGLKGGKVVVSPKVVGSSSFKILMLPNGLNGGLLVL